MNECRQRERSSLQGVRVVNTRSPKQARELDVLLEQRGAQPLSYPCIDIAPALDNAPLDSALRRATEGAFDWLVFTSANAVEAVEERLLDLGIEAGRLDGMKIAVVGPGTAAAVAERLGRSADLCPDQHIAEMLAEELVCVGARSVLLPKADRARESLVRILGENGVEVEGVVAYRTVIGSGGVDLPRLLENGGVDVVVFASPSAVDNMAVRLEQENGDWEALRTMCAACVGPVTAAAAERRGLELRLLPLTHTLPALVEALERFFRHAPRTGERAR